MITIMLNGFLTGLCLQIAIGPLFFFLLNISLQRTIMDGWFAVGAVTIADYIFITLAVLGVGKLLERPKIKLTLGLTSSIVLILFGIMMMVSSKPTAIAHIPNHLIESDYISSFSSAFLLTVSSPLTIVFWTSLFAARAIEKGYTKNQLVCFGFAAGLATFVFLGMSVTLFSTMKASIPMALLQISNITVGALLVVYGTIRIVKIAMSQNSIRCN